MQNLQPLIDSLDKLATLQKEHAKELEILQLKHTQEWEE